MTDPAAPFQGKKNIYTCERCAEHIVTIDRDPGVTPFMIPCKCTFHCKGMMRSSFYRVDQSMKPRWEWFKPESVEGLAAWEVAHVSKGGLMLREVAKPIAEVPVLLPCPFCGTAPNLIEIRELPDNFVREHSVRCDDCGIDTFAEYESEVVAAWNTRHSPKDGFQARVAQVHDDLFHDDPTDVAERVSRFFEEACEVFQAFDMAKVDALALVVYVFNRRPGEPRTEVGQAALTLASLCIVADLDMMGCAEADLVKLQQPETIARIKAKRSTRHGRGPLPGLDPAASEYQP